MPQYVQVPLAGLALRGSPVGLLRGSFNRDDGQQSQERRIDQGLDVRLTLHRRIGHLDEHGDADADRKTRHEGSEQCLLEVGFEGCFGDKSAVEKTDVVEGLGTRNVSLFEAIGDHVEELLVGVALTLDAVVVEGQVVQAGFLLALFVHHLLQPGYARVP